MSFSPSACYALVKDGVAEPYVGTEKENVYPKAEEGEVHDAVIISGTTWDLLWTYAGGVLEKILGDKNEPYKKT